VAFLYSYAWFVGFFLSGGLYYVMMLGHRSRLELDYEHERKVVA
jgi:cytosine/uracil/thiamine/allantoin permease